MPRLRFEFDWVDSERIASPELSATWASLAIAVDDSVVTRIFDGRARTVRDHIYLPLYPLAEWLAMNWWFLSSEFQTPYRQGDRDFQARHSLHANREGYAFPRLEVVASGIRTRVSWWQYAPQWTRVEFLDQGSALLDSQEFRRACFDLIDGVIRRLHAHGIDDTLLNQEWAAIQRTEQDADERKFCETAAGLGLDPYDMDESTRGNVLEVAGGLGDLLDEAVQVLDPASLLAQSSAITGAIGAAESVRLGLPGLRNPRLGYSPLSLQEGPALAYARAASSEVSPAGPGRDEAAVLPWLAGYDCAREVRRELGLDGQPLATMAALAEALGEDGGLVDEATRPVQSLSGVQLVDGLVVVNGDRTASFALRQQNEHGRRFSFCRALGELLMSPHSRSLVTGCRSERQQRNRAFAAEFLAPSAELRQAVTRPVVSDEDVDELAGEFGVSSRVIRHQIENHRIAQLSEPALDLKE